MLSNCYGSNAFVLIVGVGVGRRLSGRPVALGIALVMNLKNPSLLSQLRGQSFTPQYADDTMLT